MYRGRIEILHLIDGARSARGLAVIIDVFRAFSLECTLIALGAREVRRGRIKGNPQSERFWHVCGFTDTQMGYDTDGYHVNVMTKSLA